ncbi:MAG: phosphoenolpyruvate--protein phosphotransferase [Thermoanaerobaculia bacterium]
MERQPMQRLHGLGVSPGIAIGKALVIETRTEEVYRLSLDPGDVPAEVDRFRAAARVAQQEIRRVRDKVHRELGEELGAIFDAHALFLDDPVFLERMERRIREDQVNAEWAVFSTTEELEEQFARIEDDYLRQRMEDLQDVAHQILRGLQGLDQHDHPAAEAGRVVVADELPPSYTLRLGREQVLGFAVESGGRTSHTAILARSFNLPLVVGISDLRKYLYDEDPVILDGDAGTIILHPTEEVLAEYQSRLSGQAEQERALVATRSLEARTSDGEPLYLMANIDVPEEVEAAARYGAAGIGLYRSEFLYIEKSPNLPSEAEHIAVYRKLVEAAAPHPAVIRTYDLGGKKLVRELLNTREENPVLGLRGVRLTLSRPQVFRTQLRALFQAASYGDLWLMVPLVSSLDEVRQFKALAADVAAELAREGKTFKENLKIGTMIEVPSAAVIADRLAREVDFFAIGTNDLIQYSLAVDRNNEHVANLYQPLHPALLRMLRFVVQGASAAGIPVSVCGEMAGDPLYAALLVGLGVRRLSMGPRTLPAIKTTLRELSARDLALWAEHCLELGTAGEIEDYLRGRLAQAGSLVES